MTARELVEQLERDPVFLAQRAEREAKLEAFALELRRDEAFLVGELRSLGFDLDSVWDFVNAGNKHEFLRPRVSAQYDAAYPVLMRHLLVRHHPRVREGIIRALTIRGVDSGVWQALLHAFETEEAEDLKWVLANALRVAMPAKERRKHPRIMEIYRG